MFHVNGDIIEYDGKELAVITAKLSGFRMDAVDAINNYDNFLDERVNQTVKEERIDDLSSIEHVINEAIDNWLITEKVGAHLLENIRAAL